MVLCSEADGYVCTGVLWYMKSILKNRRPFKISNQTISVIIISYAIEFEPDKPSPYVRTIYWVRQERFFLLFFLNFFLSFFSFSFFLSWISFLNFFLSFCNFFRQFLSSYNFFLSAISFRDFFLPISNLFPFCNFVFPFCNFFPSAIFFYFSFCNFFLSAISFFLQSLSCLFLCLFVRLFVCLFFRYLFMWHKSITGFCAGIQTPSAIKYNQL